jgi:hypothetical protein
MPAVLVSLRECCFASDIGGGELTRTRHIKGVASHKIVTDGKSFHPRERIKMIADPH